MVVILHIVIMPHSVCCFRFLLHSFLAAITFIESVFHRDIDEQVHAQCHKGESFIQLIELNDAIINSDDDD